MESIDEFIDRVNLIGLLDHSGRAGNGFFLSVFDQHPEVLTCHWVHYVYSYIVTEFGDDQIIDARAAHRFVIERSYFRYILQELNDERRDGLISCGANPESVIDRQRARQMFDDFVLQKDTISRKELILAAYYAYAAATNRNIESIRYVLVADAVSLRTESPLNGFSGRVIRQMRKDFPGVRLISLVRDPRANFASCRHQFVNQNGNMYAIRPGNFFRQIVDVLEDRMSTEGCAYLYWFVYFAAAFRVICQMKHEYADAFYTLRNEDLNTEFVPTLQKLCDWLQISMDERWSETDYEPTSVGLPWRGTGAYNSRYQTNMHGLLENDPDRVADRVTGPNIYVTRRWRERMAAHEIAIMNILFRDELLALGYETVDSLGGEGLQSLLLKPFRGELPTPSWIISGRYDGWSEVLRRLFYALTFTSPMLIARWKLMTYYRRGIFANPNNGLQERPGG